MGAIQELIKQEQEAEQKRQEAEAKKALDAELERKAEAERRRAEEAKRREEEAKRKAEAQRQAEEQRIERDRLAREERLKKCEDSFIAHSALANSIEDFIKRAESNAFVHPMGFSYARAALVEARDLLVKDAAAIKLEIMGGQRC